MKENIAIICFKYPPKYSGYGKQLELVLSNINNHNLKFDILTAYKEELYQGNNINIIPLCEKVKKSEKKDFYLFCIKVFIWLVKNRKRYYIIHCIKAGPEAIVANIISKLLNKPMIVKVVQQELSDNEIDKSRGVRKSLVKLRNLALKNIDYFIAISCEINDNLKKNISKKSEILQIPNGVDCYSKFMQTNIEEKYRFRKKLNLPKDEIIMLFAGAINRRKGIIDLLDSIKYIGNISNKLTIVLCGPILEEVNLEKRVIEINNYYKNINIIYRGKVNNVNEYMKSADIFILPSYSEGLPNVLLEAAATGLALISTDIGGSRDIVINNQTGLLIPTNNPRYIAKAIYELVEDMNKREIMGKKAREHIEINYSIKNVAIQYEDIYNKLYLNSKYNVKK